MPLKEQYKKEIAPALKKALGIKNDLAVPRVIKVVLSVGVGKMTKDQKMIDTVENTLRRITGQKPVSTRARVSISNFKLREGMVVGYKVTLRDQRMWDFLQKLTTITFARVRDFRGISVKHIDHEGNLSIGFKEHLPFPEIRGDEVDQMHGLEVTVVSNAKSRARGEVLFRALGFPFKEAAK